MTSDPNAAIKDYAQGFVSNVIGVSGVEVEPARAETIFKELSRQVEIDNPARDQWGNWDWQYGDAQRRGELYLPWLDEPLASIRTQLQKEHRTRPLEPLWPNNKPFAIFLSHDVDAVTQYTSRPIVTVLRPVRHAIRTRQGLRGIGRSVLGVAYRLRAPQRLLRLDPLWHYEDWLKLEDTYGFKSTFFFPSHVTHPHAWDCVYQLDDVVRYERRAMVVRDMMRSIIGAGWEVGLHGSYYSAVEAGLLKEQKTQIEDGLGQPIISTRQHYLHYDVRVTPRLQADAGFKADSTQGFNRSIGFRAGTAFPYWCWDHDTSQPMPVLEIPQHIMDGALFTSNSLEYTEDLAIRHCVQIMDAVERVGGCLTLNWHPHYLNDKVWWTVYKTLLEEGHRRDAWGCSAVQLYEWWTKRERRIFSPADA